MTVATTPAADRAGPLSRRWRYGWIAELAIMVGIYVTYDTFRDLAAGPTRVAFRNAQDIIAAERFLRIYWERDIQQAFLHVDWFIAFWNIFYGTIHFVMPVIALVWMYRKAPARYVRWRNTLVLMFGLAVLSFWQYPLMPPRVMPARYGFVDTAAEYFNFGPQVRVRLDKHDEPTHESIAQFGNLYAAMPSFHIGWSTWSVLALWPLVRRRWLKALLVSYPVSLLFCITVTANHWLLDAIGGWIVLGVGYLGALGIEWLRTGRRPSWSTTRAATNADSGA